MSLNQAIKNSLASIEHSLKEEMQSYFQVGSLYGFDLEYISLDNIGDSVWAVVPESWQLELNGKAGAFTQGCDIGLKPFMVLEPYSPMPADINKIISCDTRLRTIHKLTILYGMKRLWIPDYHASPTFLMRAFKKLI